MSELNNTITSIIYNNDDFLSHELMETIYAMVQEGNKDDVEEYLQEKFLEAVFEYLVDEIDLDSYDALQAELNDKVKALKGKKAWSGHSPQRQLSYIIAEEYNKNWSARIFKEVTCDIKTN